MAELPESHSRRDWLLRGLEVIVAATVAVLLYPVARFLRPRKQMQSGALEVVAPFRLNQLKLQAQPPFDFDGKPCLVVCTPEGEVRAFNAVCTHLDCTVGFRADHGDIFCQCHLGVYDLHGRNVSGPPPRSLEAYKVTLRGDKDKPGQEEIIVSRTT
ncbi:MAG TPA: ubiquinol-cytochrome c reductase iron-sulfur subunit [Gemmataceae bacterium]|nr:ubiquinol-cytochrome c reductase iron-sulfur subunit [Gemmataceae bacterium]